MLPGNLSTGIGQCCSQHKVRPRSAHQKRLKLQEWFQCQLQESPALTTLLQWGKHATQVLFFWWTIDHIGWSWMLAPQHYNFNHLKPEGQQLKLHLTHMTESTEVAATHMCWGKVLPSAGSCAVAPLLAFPLRSWQQKKPMGFRPVEVTWMGWAVEKPRSFAGPWKLGWPKCQKFCWLKEQLFKYVLLFFSFRVLFCYL